VKSETTENDPNMLVKSLQTASSQHELQGLQLTSCLC